MEGGNWNAASVGESRRKMYLGSIIHTKLSLSILACDSLLGAITAIIPYCYGIRPPVRRKRQENAKRASMRPTFTVIDQPPPPHPLLIAAPEWEWRQFSCLVNM